MKWFWSSVVFFAAVKCLDFYSTVIQGSYTVEENPVVRFVWQHAGIPGFVLLNMFFVAVIAAGVYALVRYFNSQWYSLIHWVGGIATLSIVFVNLTWIPYEYSTWIDVIYKYIGV